jgi:hypothetical protein
VPVTLFERKVPGIPTTQTEYQAMTTPHPYLDLNENPIAAIFRLLPLMRDDMQEFGAVDFYEVQMAEAIIYQAKQAHELINEGMAAIMQYVPPMPKPYSPNHAKIAKFLTYLHHEAEAAQQLTDVYQWTVDDFYDNNPDLELFYSNPPQDRKRYKHQVAEKARTLLAKYDKHYYFPLGRLMQLLPGDITNVPRLTPEQGEMCSVVSRLADSACSVINSGLADLAELRRIADKAAPRVATPNFKAFVDYLQAEAEFMRGNQADYRAAARNIMRAV